MEKPNVLFFSRQAYTDLFPRLHSEKYNSFHVTLNREEKEAVEALGGTVAGCLEEEFPELPVHDFSPQFLESGFYADRSLGHFSLQERYEILGKSIAFWERIFAQRPYTGAVHETISIEQEEIFSKVAEKHNCRDLNFFISPVPGYFYWKESPFHSGWTQERLDNSEVIVSQEIKDYLSKVKTKGHKPFFVQNISKQRQMMSKRGFIFGLIKFELEKRLGNVQKYSDKELLRDSVFYSGTLSYAQPHSTEQVIQRYQRSKYDYDKLEDYSGFKTIFFPLHYEPEATLLYFDPRYSEQEAVLQQIVKNLPHDCVLAVKEHPQQPGALMWPKFYELRKRNPNLLFLPAEMDSHQILKQTHAVVTICGSVGWEALVNNIPVIVLANVFYDKHPDVVKPENMAEIKDYLCGQKLLPTPDDANTLDFLGRIQANCFPGNPANQKQYDNPENIAHIVAAIEQAL